MDWALFLQLELSLLCSISVAGLVAFGVFWLAYGIKCFVMWIIEKEEL